MKESLAEQLARLTGKPIPEKHKKKKKLFPLAKEENLQKGSIIYVPLSSDEGLILTSGYGERNKFITIIGETTDGNIIGSLLVNTNSNNSTPELEACQYSLKKSSYQNILDYDSWLDCSQLFRIPKNKILKYGRFCGIITDEDREYIFRFLVETDVLSRKEKKEFGITP